MVKKRKCNKNAASFTPNSALPNVTALIRVLSVSGDEGVQPAQGAVVGADQGADDDTLPPPSTSTLHCRLPDQGNISSTPSSSLRTLATLCTTLVRAAARPSMWKVMLRGR